MLLVFLFSFSVQLLHHPFHFYVLSLLSAYGILFSNFSFFLYFLVGFFFLPLLSLMLVYIHASICQVVMPFYLLFIVTSTQHPFFRFSILRTFILSIFFASRVSRKTFQRPFLPFQPKSLNLSLVLTFDFQTYNLFLLFI